MPPAALLLECAMIDSGAPAPDVQALQRLRRGDADTRPTAAASDQIPMPVGRWRTRVLLPAAILVVTGGLLAYSAFDVLMPAVTVQTVAVVPKTSGASAGSATIVQAPGWVEADPFATAVSALADGVVRDVLVLEGERVEAGQIVARLVDDDARLGLARAEALLAIRRAELEQARAALQEAESNWQHPIERTRKLATAEAELARKTAELAAWPSELARETARAAFQHAEFERIETLFNNKQASDIELILARQMNEAQRAIVEFTGAREAVLKAEITGLAAEVAAAREGLARRIPETRELSEARAVLQRAEANVLAAEADRDEAALRLERMEVRSPSAGVAMTRLVTPGAKLMLAADNPTGAQVLRVYDPERLQVRVDIPLADAAKVGVGQSAEVVVDVLPERRFKGVVTRVVHEADVQKNTLQVKVAIESPSPEIKPEMLARARFLGSAKPASAPAGADVGLFVPESLVHRSADGQCWVWLADRAASRARRRSIVVSEFRVEGHVEVSQGLQPGDLLIAAGAEALREGARIRVAAAGGEE